MSDDPTPPLQRQLSSAEKSALKVALEKVKSVQKKVLAEGLTPLTFFLGMLNIVSTHPIPRSPTHSPTHLSTHPPVHSLHYLHPNLIQSNLI